MRAAQAAYKKGDDNQSLELLSQILEVVPTSKKARIGAAEAIFSNSDKTDDKIGLTLLQGTTLDKYAWEEIKKVMPTEYQQYFGDVKQ